MSKAAFNEDDVVVVVVVLLLKVLSGVCMPDRNCVDMPSVSVAAEVLGGTFSKKAMPLD